MTKEERKALYEKMAIEDGCEEILNNAKLNHLLNSTEFVNENGILVYTGGFFEAPASTKYHGAYEGGLFDHLKNTYVRLKKLTEQNGLRWQSPLSVWKIAWLHDTCKFDQYIYDSVEKAWHYNPDTVEKGHGDKSVKLVRNCIDLTDEEALCIRFHMGAYEKEAWKEFDDAIHQTENVLWTHMADMLASKIDEE